VLSSPPSSVTVVVSLNNDRLPLGAFDGVTEGAADGFLVGAKVGDVGANVGRRVGRGDVFGDSVGFFVGFTSRLHFVLPTLAELTNPERHSPQVLATVVHPFLFNEEHLVLLALLQSIAFMTVAITVTACLVASRSLELCKSLSLELTILLSSVDDNTTLETVTELLATD
jgi:hypothetical protein